MIETTRSFVDWKAGSPAFTYRGSAENCVSFYKEVGKLTVHLEILQREDRLADINVRLTDETRRDRSSFEVELFKDQRCIETVNTTKDSIALFSAIAIDNYKLKISDRKGEITSFSIRMER